MCVDSDGQRAEAFEAELPDAFGHQIFPVDLFDLLDLQGLHGGGSAGHREITSAILLHQFGASRRKAAFPKDGANTIVAQQAFGETIHPHARRRADGERLVSAGADFADVGRSAEQGGAAPVHGWRNFLVEDADEVCVPDAENDAVEEDGVADAKLADVGFRQRRFEAVFRHRVEGES